VAAQFFCKIEFYSYNQVRLQVKGPHKDIV